jgi:hypothetical protein
VRNLLARPLGTEHNQIMDNKELLTAVGTMVDEKLNRFGLDLDRHIDAKFDSFGRQLESRIDSKLIAMEDRIVSKTQNVIFQMEDRINARFRISEELADIRKRLNKLENANVS